MCSVVCASICGIFACVWHICMCEHVCACVWCSCVGMCACAQCVHMCVRCIWYGVCVWYVYICAPMCASMCACVVCMCSLTHLASPTLTLTPNPHPTSRGCKFSTLAKWVWKELWPWRSIFWDLTFLVCMIKVLIPNWVAQRNDPNLVWMVCLDSTFISTPLPTFSH